MPGRGRTDRLPEALWVPYRAHSPEGAPKILWFHLPSPNQLLISSESPLCGPVSVTVPCEWKQTAAVPEALYSPRRVTVTLAGMGAS